MRLTKRRQEVLHLVCCGLTNSEIAEILSISLVTVKAHIGDLFRYFKINNRVLLVLRAQQQGVDKPNKTFD